LRSGRVDWTRLTPLPRWLTDNGAIKQLPQSSSLEAHRIPTQRQQSRWKAIQAAKRKGVPILRIARELGMGRMTVRKYMAAPSPPVYSPRQAPQEAPGMALPKEMLAIGT
jgi:hypothetical protein